MYPFISIKYIDDMMPLIKKYQVSKVALSQGQFLENYRKYSRNLPEFWNKKRDNFIKRHMAQYKINPTLRRRLSLIVWAFDPEK
jgi:hypothetical protein